MRIFLLFLLVTTGSLFAEKVDKFEFEDVAGDLRCPTCTGLSILDSDAEFSNSIKGIVKKKLSEGKSKDEILSFFVSRYGPWILREPPKEGINLFAWLIPLLVILLGPLFIWFRFWRYHPNTEDIKLVSRTVIIDEFKSKLEKLKKQRGPS